MTGMQYCSTHTEYIHIIHLISHDLQRIVNALFLQGFLHFVNKVLITDGSSGLGLELAKIYAKHSGEVIITGRNGEKLVEAHNQLKKISNCKVITKQIDFISIHDLKDFLKEIGIPNC